MKRGRTIANTDDFQLLRRFVETNSQEAFGQLVKGHLDLVYAVCLRETHDPVLAQDVTQAVFLTLFHKASTIRKGTVLAGWLFNTARFAAKNALRQEVRRKAVEQEFIEAMSQSTSHAETWQTIEPLLHEAIASLGARDREAILLRYFQDKSLREVGLEMGTTEHAAQMRVVRAIEKLKRFLHKNGVAVPVALLSALLAQHAAPAAPASCAQAVGHQLLGATTGSTTATSVGATSAKAHAISQGVRISMSVTKLKVTAALVALAVVGVGATTSVSRTMATAEGLRHSTMAAKYGGEHNVPAAIAEARKAVAADPANLSWQYELGVKLQRAGQSEEAVAVLRRVAQAEDDDNSKWAAGILRKIEANPAWGQPWWGK